MVMMKKLIAVFAMLTLLLCGVASHGETAEAGASIKCLIENGSYVIRVESGNGLGWIADDMAQDDSVVKLGRAESLDGAFVARYDPVGDGDATVSIRHYTGIACDEAHTFDLRVENGAVTESTGGSFTASPDETEQDPYLCGEWLESETQFTRMTIAKNEGRGWDVEITSPLTHGAYVFKTTIYYDCDLDSLVYDKGKFWDAPIADAENPELGEAKIAGSTGAFTFTGDDQKLCLTWHDDQQPEQQILFERDPGDCIPAAEGHSPICQGESGRDLLIA